MVENAVLYNIVLRTVSVLNHNEFVAVYSKYATGVSNISECFIKQNIWCAFCDTVTFLCGFAILCVFLLLRLCYMILSAYVA